VSAFRRPEARIVLERILQRFQSLDLFFEYSPTGQAGGVLERLRQNRAHWHRYMALNDRIPVEY
jgi:hypothetical protein